MEEMKMEVNEAVENTTAEDTKENKMGVMPMNKLLLNMALPMMASMLIQACYNVVDSAFVARLKDGAEAATSGTAALNAVGMAFPFQTLLIAVGSGTCVGVNALLSKALGEKDTKTVNKAANNGVFLALMSYLVFLFVGIFLSETLIKSQGGDGLTLVYGTQYLSIVCIGSIGIYMQFIFERLLQSTGRTFYTMITQMTGAIINIILDPIFIFTFKMGIEGAAWATNVAMFTSCLYAIWQYSGNRPVVRLRLRRIGIYGKIFWRAAAIGFAPFLQQLLASVINVSLSVAFVKWAVDDAVATTQIASLGVFQGMMILVVMPVMGAQQGLQPIIGYNWGARNCKRVGEAMKHGLWLTTVFCVIACIIQVVPPLPELFRQWQCT